eukprot:TRINITY_DN18793_c0_g1_i1.p1 TRINITY_DN18793_c0_g1~~TRINITY_DN18793_c0_g1_i1.p1  ORF type:complete len:774 (-),score=119.69 TRINITY_DN18793_c0_g1_i1:49-2370(-)
MQRLHVDASTSGFGERDRKAIGVSRVLPKTLVVFVVTFSVQGVQGVRMDYETGLDKPKAWRRTHNLLPGLQGDDMIFALGELANIANHGYTDRLLVEQRVRSSSDGFSRAAAFSQTAFQSLVNMKDALDRYGHQSCYWEFSVDSFITTNTNVQQMKRDDVDMLRARAKAMLKSLNMDFSSAERLIKVLGKQDLFRYAARLLETAIRKAKGEVLIDSLVDLEMEFDNETGLQRASGASLLESFADALAMPSPKEEKPEEKSDSTSATRSSAPVDLLQQEADLPPGSQPAPPMFQQPYPQPQPPLQQNAMGKTFGMEQSTYGMVGGAMPASQDAHGNFMSMQPASGAAPQQQNFMGQMPGMQQGGGAATTGLSNVMGNLPGTQQVVAAAAAGVSEGMRNAPRMQQGVVPGGGAQPELQNAAGNLAGVQPVARAPKLVPQIPMGNTPGSQQTSAGAPPGQQSGMGNVPGMYQGGGGSMPEQNAIGNSVGVQQGFGGAAQNAWGNFPGMQQGFAGNMPGSQNALGMVLGTPQGTGRATELLPNTMGNMPGMQNAIGMPVQVPQDPSVIPRVRTQNAACIVTTSMQAIPGSTVSSASTSSMSTTTNTSTTSMSTSDTTTVCNRPTNLKCTNWECPPGFDNNSAACSLPDESWEPICVCNPGYCVETLPGGNVTCKMRATTTLSAPVTPCPTPSPTPFPSPPPPPPPAVVEGTTNMSVISNGSRVSSLDMLSMLVASESADAAGQLQMQHHEKYDVEEKKPVVFPLVVCGIAALMVGTS